MKEHIRQLLREGLLGEGGIVVPREVINKGGILFDLINSKKDMYTDKAGPNFNSPFVAFKDYFKVDDQKGKPLSISVGLYNDDNDAGFGRMDTDNNMLLLNMAYFDRANSNEFEHLITHEMVHAMDPLVSNKKVYSSYYMKKGAEPDKDYDKYRKSQHEYKAELTPLINKINKITGYDDNRVKWVLWIIQNIKVYNTVEDVYYSTYNHMFGEGKTNPLFTSDAKYWYFLNTLFDIIKPWTKDDKLYKKFLSDLYKGIKK